MSSSKIGGRTPAQISAAWVSWRKQIVDDNFPEMCSCRIGKSPREEFKRTACCKIVSCGMAIKNAYVDEHRKTCKICSDVDAPPHRYLPPVGEPVDAKPK